MNIDVLSTICQIILNSTQGPPPGARYAGRGQEYLFTQVHTNIFYKLIAIFYFYVDSVNISNPFCDLRGY